MKKPAPDQVSTAPSGETDQLLNCLPKLWKNTSEVSRTKFACAVASVVAQSTPDFFAASSSVDFRSLDVWSGRVGERVE